MPDKKSKKRSIENFISKDWVDEDFYRYILDSVMNGVWVSDPDDIIRYCSRPMEKIAGVDKKQIVGKNILNDFPFQTINQFKPFYLKAKKTRKPVFYDSINIIDLAGRDSWRSGWIIPMCEDGECKGIICTVHDMTKQKLAEMQLKEYQKNIENIVEKRTSELSEAKIKLEIEIAEKEQLYDASLREKALAQRYLDMAGAIIVELDKQGRITLINRMGCRITGYSEDELLGKNWFNTVIPEKLRMKVKSTFQKLMEGQIKKLEYFQNEIKSKSGEIREIAWRNSILKDKSGKICGTLSFGEDVTEKNFADRLIRTQRDLGLQLSAQSSLEEVLRISLGTAIELTDMDSGGIYILNHRARKLDLAYHVGLSKSFVEKVKSYDHKSRQMKLILSGKQVVGNYAQMNISKEVGKKDESLHSILVVPLKHEGKTIGSINLGSHKHDNVPGRSKDSLETIVSQISMAIANAMVEEKLALEREQMISIFDSVNEIIYVCDMENYEILYVNQYFQDKLGFNPTGMKCYKTIYDLKSPCSFCTNSIIKKQPGNHYSWEFHNDKLKGFFQLTDKIIKWTDGRDVRIELAIDITKLKEVENSLLEEKKFAESLIDTAQVVILVLETNGKIVWFNNYLEELSGLKSSDHKGENWIDLLIPQKNKSVTKSIFRSIVKGERTQGDVSPIVVNGRKERFVDWRAKHLRKPTGEVIGILLTGLDITDRVHAEQAIKTHEALLEKLVDERAVQLREAQDELVQKERLATLGRLIAVVSHEIKNPLGTIASSMYTIRERTSEASLGIENALERIDRSVTRCDRIIEELLYYTRTRTSQMKFINLDRWIKTALTETLIPDYISLKYDLNCDLNVEFDSEKLQRCLFNLVNNSIQAINEKLNLMQSIKRISGKITLKTALRKNKIEIHVIDNGCGMSNEVINRILEPFYSTKSFGAGLGLSITKQIMDEHNGEIEIKSKIGQGTTVILRLPDRKR